jgi:hypothetical protein
MHVAVAARGPGPHFFQADLEPPHRHGELGAQVILVRLNLVDRHRRGVDDLLLGDAYRALVNERNKHQHQQASRQHADTAQHDRFDHRAPAWNATLIELRGCGMIRRQIELSIRPSRHAYQPHDGK